ncbi:hypothetical protein [Roseateles chitinivorans]
MSRHIDAPAGLPPFERVLSVPADGRLDAPSADGLPVARHKQDRLAALALGANRFLVVSAPDEVHRPDWYRLVQAGKARG